MTMSLLLLTEYDPFGMAYDPHRRRCDVAVPIEVESNTGSYRAITQNIGIGGVFVATAQLGNVGELVTLRFAVATADDWS